jgi:hypothetical protein
MYEFAVCTEWERVSEGGREGGRRTLEKNIQRHFMFVKMDVCAGWWMGGLFAAI